MKILRFFLALIVLSAVSGCQEIYKLTGLKDPRTQNVNVVVREQLSHYTIQVWINGEPQLPLLSDTLSEHKWWPRITMTTSYYDQNYGNVWCGEVTVNVEVIELHVQSDPQQIYACTNGQPAADFTFGQYSFPYGTFPASP